MLKRPVGKANPIATAAGAAMDAANAARGALRNMRKHPMSIEVEKHCQICKDETLGEGQKKKKRQCLKSQGLLLCLW